LSKIIREENGWGERKREEEETGEGGYFQINNDEKKIVKVKKFYLIEK